MDTRLVERLFLVAGLLAGCAAPAPGSFKFDLDFLRKHDPGLVVLHSGDERVIVSPKYQGKVFTSTDSGDAGPSFGWIHYKAFEGAPDAHMNAYGGENRLWLGPEGGRFSLFFPPGAKMEFANWKTPAAFDTEPWKVLGATDTTVKLMKVMKLTNYAGHELKITVGRMIMMWSRVGISRRLHAPLDEHVAAVGYETENILINGGTEAWNDTTGMPCIWMLDMLKPSPSTVIVVPYQSAPGDTSKPATTDYFGEIPADRIKFAGGKIFFRADGRSRGKLGVHPARALNVIGSYDAEHGVLTIARFDMDTAAKYLNQEWNTMKPPFSGDAVNAYNDGPLTDGSQMGPFYELESVAPAWPLAPGSMKSYGHDVFHFTGPEASLDKISRAVLGVSIAEIKAAFQ
ncbi:MAG TPA: DUF6786 family protein [Puia sp.]|nr:DUF6786 family protein [Puia sp.]